MRNAERIYDAAFPERPLESFEKVEVLIFVEDGTHWERYGCSDGCCSVDPEDYPPRFDVQVNVISTKPQQILLRPKDPEWNVFKPAAERPGMNGYFHNAEGVYGSYGQSSASFKMLEANSVVLTKTFSWQHAALLLKNLFVEDGE
jgi:hypothetical protein